MQHNISPPAVRSHGNSSVGRIPKSISLYKRINFVSQLHPYACLGAYESQVYHLALLNMAVGDQFKKAISKACREVAMRFMDRAVSKQAREATALRRSKRSQAVQA